MNLEEMKKIWDSENNRTLYAIDENGMERIVQTKNSSAQRSAYKVEKWIIGINVLGPLIILAMMLFRDNFKWSVILLVSFMLGTALYVLYHRRRRMSHDNMWDNDVMGKLEEGIYHATYRARLTNTLLVWYLVGIAAITILILALEMKSTLYLLGFGIFFMLTFIFGRLEQKYIHEKPKNELLKLRDTLAG